MSSEDEIRSTADISRNQSTNKQRQLPSSTVIPSTQKPRKSPNPNSLRKGMLSKDKSTPQDTTTHSSYENCGRSKQSPAESSSRVGASNPSNKNKISVNPNFMLSQAKFTSRVSQKIEELAKHQEASEMAECTFKPQINSSGKQRSLENFLKNQEDFQKKKQGRLSLNNSEGKADKVLSTSGNDAHERLYRTPKVMSVDFDHCPSFQPSINEKSKLLKREDSIDTHLYKDAMRRAEKKEECPQDTFKTPTNNLSEKILRTKLKDEFNKSVQEPISYSLFLDLLEKMNFIRREKDRDLGLKAWNSFGVEKTVSKTKLFKFLLGVMNLSKSKEIHQSYVQLYRNRLTTAPKKPPEIFVFKPKISEKSMKLAAKHYRKKRGGSSSLEFLTNESVYNKNQSIKKRFDTQMAENVDCSFKPSINKHTRHKSEVDFNLDSKAYIYKKIRDNNSSPSQVSSNLFRLSIELRDRQMNTSQNEESFSFTPMLRKSLLKGKKPIGEAKGVNSSVERMHRARTIYEPTPTIIETRPPPIKYSKTMRDRSTSSLFNIVSPIAQKEDASEGSNSSFNMTPTHSYPMTISVKLPDGQIESLVIQNDEDIESAIDRFVAQFKLDEDAESMLRQTFM